MARQKNLDLKVPKYLHTDLHNFAVKDGFIKVCKDVHDLNEGQEIKIRILRRLCCRQLLELDARCDQNFSPTAKEERLLKAYAAMGLKKDETDLVNGFTLSEGADRNDEVDYTFVQTFLFALTDLLVV